jgi:tetratricopeptide (TPR) repeat protein
MSQEMGMERLCKVVYSKVYYFLLVVFACIQVAPHLISSYGFTVALRPLYTFAFSSQARISGQCSDLELEVEGTSHLTAENRLAVGSILRSLGCLDLATHVLPEFTTSWNRSVLLAYQWGMIAWAQGDVLGAATIWGQGPGIDHWLLRRARQPENSDAEESWQWYEVAIFAANSPQQFAQSLTAYTEDTRGRLAPAIFKERLAYLETWFGADTAAGARLRGLHSLMDGSYRAAYEQLEQAISLGMNDAETWYLLGNAAWKLTDLSGAEEAYRNALAAPIQINWRRAWHLDRLASLLAATGRPAEALPFSKEAVRLDDYYYYADHLSMLYTQLGEEALAQTFCLRAREHADSPQQLSLKCELP